MKQLATIITLTLTLNCFGQFQFDKTKISKQTEQIVVKLEKINELMSSAVYYAGIRPEQYDNFTELQKRATKDELTELTNYPNGVVRCYAIWALSYDSSASLFPIVIKHLNDTTSVKKQFGCIGSREKVGDFFINVVTPQYVDLDSKKLTDSELTAVDSMLVYMPNTLYAREKAISRSKLTENLYLKVRELVINENNQSALVTLAKFRREQDIPLILKNKTGNKSDDGLFFTYQAISQFPNPAFLPLLKKTLYKTLDDTHYDSEWSELYRAIASYKNNTSLQLLKVPFTQVRHRDIREYHIQYVFGAVQSFYLPLYNGLLWTMWANEKLITPEVFKILYQKDSGKAFHLTTKTIENANDFYYLSTNGYENGGQAEVNLIDIMLDTIINKDRALAVKLINKNIKQINVHEFPTFADKALKLKDTSFISSLFERLEKEDNPHIFLKAIKVLIAFNDNNINKRIAEVSKKNSSLQEGWGGQNLAELLKENNIN